jgi:hypothetical protein
LRLAQRIALLIAFMLPLALLQLVSLLALLLR